MAENDAGMDEKMMPELQDSFDSDDTPTRFKSKSLAITSKHQLKKSVDLPHIRKSNTKEIESATIAHGTRYMSADKGVHNGYPQKRSVSKECATQKFNLSSKKLSLPSEKVSQKKMRGTL